MSIAPFARGDSKTFPFSFKVKDSDPPVPIDISGKHLRFTMKASKDDPDPGALQKTLGPFTGPEAVAGTGTLTLTSTETDGLTPGKYFFDFQLSDPSVSPPYVTTVGQGVIVILQDVTRSVPT